MKYSFPKVDLHLHLDGSFIIPTVWELVQKQNVTMPTPTLEEYDAWMVKCSNAEDVNDFLKMFDAPLQVMQDKESIIRITRELIEDIDAQGLAYAEIRFAPQLHTAKGMSQREAIEAVLEGRRQGLEKCPNIKIGIICCMMSVGPETLNWDANMETASIVHEYLDKGVVCMDLAGAEGFVPLSNFKPLFDKAISLGTPVICHAGDSQDWKTVKDAIDMGARRIGHGHHIYENPELCRIAAEKGIALEICPTSNIQCKTRATFPLHPAQNLLNMGIPVTINTDNMTMSRTTLDDEYDVTVYGPEGESSMSMVSGGEKIAIALALRLGITQQIFTGERSCFLSMWKNYWKKRRKEKIRKNSRNSSFSRSSISANSLSILAHIINTSASSFLAYSFKSSTYLFPLLIMSSSDTFATYIIGFAVIRLNDDSNFCSSSSISNFLIGIFFSSDSFILVSKLYSFKSSLFLVVCAFFPILFILLSIISKSDNISSTFIISTSLLGFTSPSTCMIFESSKHLTTSTIASVSLMCDKNLLPNPSPSDAPFTNPAMSVNSNVVGIVLSGVYIFSNSSTLLSGTITVPTFGSIVANG